jgi:aminopeptidase N
VARGQDGARVYQLLVYQKGAWVLHMLRTLLIDLKTMNEEHFTAVMRDFYTTYQGQYATTADFQRTVEKRVGQPMDWFFSQWVYGTAIPTYKYSHEVEPTADGKYRLKLTVVQEGVPTSFRMFVPVTVEFENGAKARMRVLVTGARSEPELPLLPAKPKSIKFNDLEGVLATVEQVGG